MNYSDENIDVMLFDYLEGNLSEEESVRVESQIASDPLIKQELNIWKQSYVESEDYTTSILESQLLHSPGSFSFTLFLNSILVVCLTIISSTNPKPDPFSISQSHTKNSEVMKGEKLQSLFSYHSIGIPVISLKSLSEVQTMESNELMSNVKISHHPALQLPEMSMLTPARNETLIILPKTMVVEQEQEGELCTIKELRKKEKAIRKMHKKAERERMAFEFMKGDIPYVVPVNPNNF